VAKVEGPDWSPWKDAEKSKADHIGKVDLPAPDEGARAGAGRLAMPEVRPVGESPGPTEERTMAKRENQPKPLTNSQLYALVRKLQKEGGLPSSERFAAVMKGIKDEYRPQILATRGKGPKSKGKDARPR
jgi:hypothetical protein